MFDSASVLSDVIRSVESEDFDGGCFFGDFADVPENGSAMMLNLLNSGNALETRKDYILKGITEATRLAEVKNTLYGIGEVDFVCASGVAVSRISNGKGFNVTCSHGKGTPMDISFSASASGRHIFRIYIGESICPNIKIYEGDSVYFNGTPDILDDESGKRYACAEFEGESVVTVTLTYRGSGNAVYTIEKLQLLGVDALTSLGFAENCLENVFFDGETGICSGVFSVFPGRPDAECFANGKYIFKKGNMLICGEPETDEFFVECADLPVDCRTAIYHNGSGFTVLCEGHGVFITDDKNPCIGCVEKPFRVPHMYTLYNGHDGSDYGEPEEKWNMLSEYFLVTLSGLSGSEFQLPESLIVDGSYYDIVDENTLEPVSGYRIKLETYEGGGGKIQGIIISTNICIKLRLLSADDGGRKTAQAMEIYKDLIFSPLGSEECPSLQGTQNNIILYGGNNENYFAVARLSEYLTSDDILISENNEKVTSILRYSENFLLFSPHSIKRMTVTENMESQSDESDMENVYAVSPFTVTLQNFKYDVGCDMPGSAVCADDKIIYANSRAGVFYINRFGFSEKDMSRHVSANIEEGENGFFACDSDDLREAQALICGGKYFLRIGEVFYVWDFAHAVPSSSTEKESEERKLKWFVYSAEGCEKLLGADAERLYFLAEDGNLGCLCRGSALDSSAESYFRSREYSLSPFGMAAIWKISLSLAAGQSCTLRLYFDGEESAVRYTVNADSEKSTLCEIIPAEKMCRRFAFSLHSFGGIRLDGVRIEFLKRR